MRDDGRVRDRIGGEVWSGRKGSIEMSVAGGNSAVASRQGLTQTVLAAQRTDASRPHPQSPYLIQPDNTLTSIPHHQARLPVPPRQKRPQLPRQTLMVRPVVPHHILG